MRAGRCRKRPTISVGRNHENRRQPNKRPVKAMRWRKDSSEFGMENGGQVLSFGSCRCGHGWCEVHGTYDLPNDFDFSPDPLDVPRVQSGTRGGRRVEHKKLGGDNY